MKKVLFIFAAMAVLAFTLSAISLADDQVWSANGGILTTNANGSHTVSAGTNYIQIQLGTEWNMVDNDLSFTLSGLTDNPSGTVYVNYHSTTYNGYDATWEVGALKNGTFTFSVMDGAPVVDENNGGMNIAQAVDYIKIYPFSLTDPIGATQLKNGAAGGLTISNLKGPVTVEKDVPEPLSIAYGAMGLVSILGLKKKLAK